MNDDVILKLINAGVYMNLVEQNIKSVKKISDAYKNDKKNKEKYKRQFLDLIAAKYTGMTQDETEKIWMIEKSKLDVMIFKMTPDEIKLQVNDRVKQITNVTPFMRG